MRTNALLCVDRFTFNHLLNFENPYYKFRRVSAKCQNFTNIELSHDTGSYDLPLAPPVLFFSRKEEKIWGANLIYDRALEGFKRV